MHIRKKIKSNLYYLAISWVLTSCGANSKNSVIEKDTVTTVKAIHSIQTDTTTCLDLVEKLVHNSSFKTITTENLTVWIDDISDNIVRIKITHTNEDENDIPIAWLELDMIKNELRDVTKDPNNPIQLTFDKQMLEKIKEKCKP